MIYTVYKTTNKINNKIYIGVHQTNNPNDEYLGSGTLMKVAIKKYGKDSFTKSILFEYENFEDAYSKERELVTEDFIKSSMNYNLRIGGLSNGSDFSESRKGHIVTKETREKLRDFNLGKKQSNETIQKRINSYKGEKHYLHIGKYKTPWGIFDTSYDAEIESFKASTIRNWCKEPETIINIHSLKQNEYLKSLIESPIGKTRKDLGFELIGN